MQFTHRFIDNLKPTTGRKVYYEDSGHGTGSLGIRVSPNGHKSWLYSYSFNKRVRHMTLGTFPLMTVAQAHEAYGQAMALCERGIDPGARRVLINEAAREAPSVEDLATAYVEQWAKPRKRSWEEDDRILKRDVIPAWKGLKAEAVTRKDVRALLEKKKRDGAPIAANRTFAVVRKMYNWAVSEDLVPNSPCVGVSMPSKETHRDRVLSDTELTTLLAKLPDAKMDDSTWLALLFQLLTSQRCGEVLSAEWKDIDLNENVWTIPAAKAKNRRLHRVPLSQEARGVLDFARLLGGKLYVFPSSVRGDKPMVETAVARAVNRNLEHSTVEPFTPHDLRRTAASKMTESGVMRLVVSKILNHVESEVTAIYDRYGYESEKRAALDSWGARLATLKQKSVKSQADVVDSGTKPSTVRRRSPRTQR